jgi:hypothetical protein
VQDTGIGSGFETFDDGKHADGHLHFGEKAFSVDVVEQMSFFVKLDEDEYALGGPDEL